MTRDDAKPIRIAVVFVSVSLGFAWTYWLLISLSRKEYLPFSMDGSIPGTILSAILRHFGPLVAAVLISAFYQGGAGPKQPWQTVARSRVPYWLYVLSLAGPVAAAGVVAWIGVQTGRIVRNTEPISAVHFILVFFAMAVVDGPLGEEVGWRGLLLPQLLRRLGPVGASTMVGGVWWLWHVPLYLADGKMSSTGEWIEFLIDTLALSLIFTWFYLKSGSSTFLTIVLHNMLNFSIFLILRNICTPLGCSFVSFCSPQTLAEVTSSFVVVAVEEWKAFCAFQAQRLFHGHQAATGCSG